MTHLAENIEKKQSEVDSFLQVSEAKEDGLLEMLDKAKRQAAPPLKHLAHKKPKPKTEQEAGSQKSPKKPKKREAKVRGKTDVCNKFVGVKSSVWSG